MGMHCGVRYFDDDFEEAAKRCFNCGEAGHMSRDCPNAALQRPCFLCARFGHDRANCPNRALAGGCSCLCLGLPWSRVKEHWLG